MKTQKLNLLFILAIVMVTGCGSDKKAELNVFNWKYYIGDSTIARFEREYHLKVNLSYYDDNEQCIAKLKSNPGNYDIVFPSGYAIATMIKEDLLYKYDYRSLPNYKNIDTSFIGVEKGFDPLDQYSVPYMYGAYGFARNEKAIAQPVKTWNEFFSLGHANKITLINDVRFVLGSMLVDAGQDANTIDTVIISRQVNRIISNKTVIRNFSNDSPVENLVSGETKLAFGANGDIVQASAQNPDIQFDLPQNGTVFFQDGICIPKDAAHVDLALKFIDFIHRADVNAEICNTIKYGTTNRAAKAYVNKKLLTNQTIFIPDDYRAKCHVLKDLGKNIQIYETYWNTIKLN